MLYGEPTLSALQSESSLVMQEWRRSIDGWNMLEQPQPFFATFKVGVAPSSGPAAKPL